MQSAELGEGMWERKLAREEEGLGIGVGTEHWKEGVNWNTVRKHRTGQRIRRPLRGVTWGQTPSSLGSFFSSLTWVGWTDILLALTLSHFTWGSRKRTPEEVETSDNVSICCKSYAQFVVLSSAYQNIQHVPGSALRCWTDKCSLSLKPTIDGTM